MGSECQEAPHPRRLAPLSARVLIPRLSLSPRPAADLAGMDFFLKGAAAAAAGGDFFFFFLGVRACVHAYDQGSRKQGAAQGTEAARAKQARRQAGRQKGHSESPEASSSVGGWVGGAYGFLPWPRSLLVPTHPSHLVHPTPLPIHIASTCLPNTQPSSTAMAPPPPPLQTHSAPPSPAPSPAPTDPRQMVLPLALPTWEHLESRVDWHRCSRVV